MRVVPRPTVAGQHSFSVKYPIAFVSADYYPGTPPCVRKLFLVLMVSDAFQMSFNVVSWRTRVERQPSVGRG